MFIEVVGREDKVTYHLNVNTIVSISEYDGATGIVFISADHVWVTSTPVDYILEQIKKAKE